ncbi:MAG: hypothetical protein NZM13_09010, partial [Cyclobacteriaceae bacterium]|nr:hypothetical protein [Cyclobacteriaceae bacterium]
PEKTTKAKWKIFQKFFRSSLIPGKAFQALKLQFVIPGSVTPVVGARHFYYPLRYLISHLHFKYLYARPEAG